MLRESGIFGKIHYGDSSWEGSIGQLDAGRLGTLPESSVLLSCWTWRASLILLCSISAAAESQQVDGFKVRQTMRCIFAESDYFLRARLLLRRRHSTSSGHRPRRQRILGTVSLPVLPLRLRDRPSVLDLLLLPNAERTVGLGREAWRCSSRLRRTAGS